ncbi:Mitochondrial inner membrane magnesium transporter mrs2 [Penicillium subrubescens]|uniref:Magnesium transporter n=2 Tax=Penicillium subrubescens TaxID=1316194 RepID=A0A1Q5TCS2_9EURO|nr:Mitochondrial inner membrane magnesium transporter mrs2 [Penicillium subrubescens]
MRPSISNTLSHLFKECRPQSIRLERGLSRYSQSQSLQIYNESSKRMILLSTKVGIPGIPRRALHINQQIRAIQTKPTPQEIMNLSLKLSHGRMNGTTELICTLFDANGAIEMPETRLTKADIARQYGVDGRDLRTADAISEGIPHFVIRPSTIFISLFSLRLLVQSNRVLLIRSGSKDNDPHAFLEEIFATDLQSKLRGNHGSGFPVSLPYELRVFEAALASVTAHLEAEHLLIRKEIEYSLEDLQSEDIASTGPRTLLENGKKLVHIEQRARQMRTALQELLSNDEDLAEMYLTDQQAGRPHAIEDHQEVEYLLEAYYKSHDAIVESAGALLSEVHRTQDAIMSVLDVRRNQIMVFEAQLEICMLGFAVSTFIAGLYGMNVINYLEDSPYAFPSLVAGCVMGTLMLARIGMLKLRKFRRILL